MAVLRTRNVRIYGLCSSVQILCAFELLPALISQMNQYSIPKWSTYCINLQFKPITSKINTMLISYEQIRLQYLQSIGKNLSGIGQA
jgi:hypothetical protein